MYHNKTPSLLSQCFAKIKTDGYYDSVKIEKIFQKHVFEYRRVFAAHFVESQNILLDMPH